MVAKAQSPELQALMARAANTVAATHDQPENVPTVDDALDVGSLEPTKPEISQVEQTQPAITAVAAPQTAKEPAVNSNKPATAVEFTIGENAVLTDLGALQLHEAIKQALGAGKSPVFKVAALQSGYTAEFGALAFEDINRLQASSVDAHAARMKLLRTLHSRVIQFSCGNIKFQDWLKQTAQGDYDTLMYGLYAATYPGENDFDTKCRHCGHDNKVTVDVNQLARVESDDVYGEIRKLLDPKTDFQGAIQNSLVGHTVQRKLPVSGIVVEISNPSIQDYLDGVQWFINMQDKNTGALPPDRAGIEVVRTLTMYVQKIYIPIPGTNNYAAVTDLTERINLISRMNRTDGEALTDAVNAENTKLEVSYSLPAYNCASCGKRNEDLYLDFEALLFIKLRAKA